MNKVNIRKIAYVMILVLLVSGIATCVETQTYASELPSIQLGPSSSNETDNEQSNELGNDKLLVIIIVAVAVVVITILIIVIVMLIRKNRHTEYKHVHISSENMNKAKSEDKSLKSLEQVMNLDKKEIPVTHKKMCIQIIDKNNDLVYQMSFDAAEENKSIVIGRGQRSKVNICIPLPNVSDQHCLIIKQYNVYYIKDLDSTNGTKYNGQKVVDKMRVDTYGVLELGRSRFELRIVEV